MPRARTGAGLVALAVLLLAACEGKDATGGGAASHAPEAATPVPAATADPDLTRKDLRFAGNDANGDGRVTPPEYAAAAQRFFAAVDTGDDGTLNVHEMEAAGKAIGVSDASLPSKTIAEADNDGDAKLTLAEFIASVNNRFRRIDTNGDGWLSPDEFSKGFAEVPAATADTSPAAGATSLPPPK